MQVSQPSNSCYNLPVMKMVRLILAAVVIGILTASGGYFLFVRRGEPIDFKSPLAQENFTEATASAEVKEIDVEIDDKPLKSPFHLLLLGSDRRSREQTHHLTDVIMLASLVPNHKQVLLTSLPRDLWTETGKINAMYTSIGVETLKNKIQEVLGITPDRYLLVDFDDFAWAIDALGGVDVEAERTFTDHNYPSHRQGGGFGVITVEFEKGMRHMDGETALIFARSRKGNNGEGSDFMRSRRQQKILEALPAAFFSTKCIFNPFRLSKFYKALTAHSETDLTISDAGKIYELVKRWKEFGVRNVVLEYDYFYSPPKEEYGGAWTLLSKDGSFEAIHAMIQEKLSVVAGEATPSAGKVFEQ